MPPDTKTTTLSTVLGAGQALQGSQYITLRSVTDGVKCAQACANAANKCVYYKVHSSRGCFLLDKAEGSLITSALWTAHGECNGATTFAPTYSPTKILTTATPHISMTTKATNPQTTTTTTTTTTTVPVACSALCPHTYSPVCVDVRRNNTRTRHNVTLVTYTNMCHAKCNGHLHAAIGACESCGEVVWKHKVDTDAQVLPASASTTCRDEGYAIKFIGFDSSGNKVFFTSHLHIVDTAAPIITTAPSNHIAEYIQTPHQPRNSAARVVAWLQSFGGAEVTDAFPGDVTWAHSVPLFEQTNPSSGCLDEHATVTFTATDGCGNTVDASSTYSFVDSQPPVVVAIPSNVSYALGSTDTPQRIRTWAQEQGGARVQDENPVSWIPAVLNFQLIGDPNKPAACLDAAAVVVFRAEDACGHATVLTGAITTLDHVAPKIVSHASNCTVYEPDLTDTAVVVGNFTRWLDNHAGATATEDDVSPAVIWEYVTTGIHPIQPKSNILEALPRSTNRSSAYIYCPNRHAFVEFYARDDCGNRAETAAWYTIITETLAVAEYVQNITVELNPATNNEQVAQWLANHGGAVVTAPPGAIALGALSWSYSVPVKDVPKDRLGDLEITTTFVAEDACKNIVHIAGTLRIADSAPPIITVQAANREVESNGQGNADAYSAWIRSNGGAVATDVGGSWTWSSYVASETMLQSALPGCSDKSFVVIFVVVDANGNAAETQATFTVRDRVAPRYNVLPVNTTTETNGDGNALELEQWLGNNGGSEVVDAANAVQWQYARTKVVALGDLSQCRNHRATYVFTATDSCGNAATASAAFTIVDTTAPIIFSSPRPLVLDADGNGNKQEIADWLASNAGMYRCCYVTVHMAPRMTGWNFLPIIMHTHLAILLFLSLQYCLNCLNSVLTVRVIEHARPRPYVVA